MNKWIHAMLFLTILLFVFTLSCKKADLPMGLYAPQGFDFPNPTPTPRSGNINVYVFDNNNLVSGITIVAVDPDSQPMTQVTQPVVGYAAFSPSSLKTGSWTAVVPPQGRYGLSTQPFTVSGSSQVAVTFQATSQSLSISPPATVFQNFNQEIPFTVTYTQAGNLNVPVSVTHGTIPNSNYIFSFTPDELLLASAVSQAPITLNKIGCYAVPVTLFFAAHDFINAHICNASASLNYGTSMATTLNYSVTPLSFGTVFSFTSTNDCGNPWNLIAIRNDLMLGPVTVVNGPVTNGWISSSIFGGLLNNVYTFQLSAQVGSYSAGPVTLPSSGTGTAFNNTFHY